MNSWRRVLLLLLALLPMSQAWAIEKPAVCPCSRPKTDKESRDQIAAAETIFLGKLLYDEDSNWAIPFLKPASFRNIFLVSKVWKGKPEKIKIVKTFAASVPCGLADTFFVRGESYLVFAFQRKDALVTDLCALNMSEKSAAAHIKFFGAGRPATEDVFFLFGRTKLLITILVLTVLLLVFLGVMYTLRRKLTSTLE